MYLCSMMNMDIRVQKKEIRSAIRELKRCVDQAWMLQASDSIMSQLESQDLFKAADTVLMYHALPDEVQTAAFLDRWYQSKRILIPLVSGDDLILKVYSPDKVVPGYKGIPEPSDDAETVGPSEVELAVIIGKAAKDVSEKDAHKHVLGYTVINDVSARNVQTRHKQWYFGKSFDGFTPMGPCIVTADEFSFPPELAIRSYVNGELRQDSSTSLLIFGIAHVISELSKGMTLFPGTVIAMGTPAGVGMGFDPPRFLSAGDEVRCEIEGIGSLTNTVK